VQLAKRFCLQATVVITPTGSYIFVKDVEQIYHSMLFVRFCIHDNVCAYVYGMVCHMYFLTLLLKRLVSKW